MSAAQTFAVPGRFPSLNEFYRMTPAQQGRVKCECDMRVKRAAEGAGLRPVGRCRVEFAWFEPNRRRDLDNVAFAKKFVLDGLVKAGVLRDDSPRYVLGLADEFGYDRDDPRVVVTLRSEP